MCNLYKTRKSVDEVARLFGADASANRLQSNLPAAIFPGMPGLVVRELDGAALVQSMAWGFPLVTRAMRERAQKAGREPRPKPVNNARELASPFWKSAASHPDRRCLIPVEMFAEAEGKKGSQTRTWFSVKGQPIFAWAGLWRPSAEWGDVYSGVMTEANDAVAPVHDRMPVILAQDNHARWLHGSFDDVLELQRPFPAEQMIVDKTPEPWGGYKPGEGKDIFAT